MIEDLLIVVGVLFAGLVGFEVLARITAIPQHLMRKIIHVGMCLLVVGFTFIFDYKVMFGTGLIFTAILLIARKVFIFHSLRDRHTESWGEFLFPLGIAISAYTAGTQEIFIAAMLILAFSDTAAYVIGKRYPRSTQIIPHRTIAGSGAGFITSMVILLVLPFSLQVVFLTAVAVAIAEIVSHKGFDNLTMPVVAAIVLTCLTTFL